MNNRRKQVSKANVILSAMCAITFSVCAIIGLMKRTYFESPYLYTLYVLSAVFSIIGFVLTYRGYRSNKEE